MFRLIPHRLLVEPKATITRLEAAADSTRAILRIDGLLCSACAANVCRALEAVPGVQNASVDLDSALASVTFDPAAANPEKLVHAVEGTVIFRPLRRLLARIGQRAHGERQRRSGSLDPDNAHRNSGPA